MPIRNRERGFSGKLDQKFPLAVQGKHVGRSSPKRTPAQPIKNLLITVPAPALPVLPRVNSRPRLGSRSYSTLSICGSFSSKDGSMGPCDAVFMQTAAGGRMHFRRSQQEREQNPDRINLDRSTSAECIAISSDLLLHGTSLAQSSSDGNIHANQRPPEETTDYPDKIYHDRKGLTCCPQILGDTKVKLLSLQHNLITRLDGLGGLSYLVFLDVYDNQLTHIEGLNSLSSLRVLLLGKNRIRHIDGLDSLKKLEVLDLHGNQICQIGGLSSLSELKVLNLAGNEIRELRPLDLLGLKSLLELNLRRNKISRVMGIADAVNLEKLYLSNNDIKGIEDMYSLVEAGHLKEITVDGNIVCTSGECVSFLVSFLPSLKFLNQMQINEEVRKVALTWRRKKEGLKSSEKGDEMQEEDKREQVITNARTHWELLRCQAKTLLTNKKLSNSLGDIVGIGDDSRQGRKLTQSDIDSPSSSNSVTDLPESEICEPAQTRAFRRPSTVSLSSTVNSAKPKCWVRPARRPGYATRRTFPPNASNNPSNSNTVQAVRLPPILKYISLSSDGLSSDVSDRDVQRKGPYSEDINGEKKLAQMVQSAVVKRSDSKAPSSRPATAARARTSRTRSNSTSSVEPNIDSSFSSLESDNDDEQSDHEEVNAAGDAVVSTNMEPVDEGGSTAKANTSAQGIKQTSQKPRGSVSTAKPRTKTAQPVGRTKEQGSDYLVEIEDECLNVYGQSSVRFLDRTWNASKAAEVTTVKFNYITFNSLVPSFGKIKHKFPNLEHFIFRSNNIHCLGQLNALAEVQGVTSVEIDADGNPIAQKEWESYAIYRLSHWGLRRINGKEVTDDDIACASEEFQSLSDVVLCSLPEGLLSPLLGRLQLGNRSSSNKSAKEWLWDADPALRSVVAKEALQWRSGNSSVDDISWRQKGRVHLMRMLGLACDAVEKLQLLEKEWPSLFHEIIRDALLDYSQQDAYMKRCMQELKL